MALVGVNPVFWTEQLHYGQAVLAERAADPLRRPVETIMGLHRGLHKYGGVARVVRRGEDHG
jgi:hypothetical protein